MRLFANLKKLFGGGTGKSVSVVTAPEVDRAAQPNKPPARETVPFLRKEIVFDRNHRSCGHIFHIQESTPLANADPLRQRGLDQTLLEMLTASPEAWNTSAAFIPLSSDSLDLAVVDRLKSANIILLIQLAPDAEADMLIEGIGPLRQRGLRFGLFRQPRHPAFAKMIHQVDYAVIDIAGNDANAARDFSAAVRATAKEHPLQLFACNVETLDDHQFCHQWHFDFFHGRFAAENRGLANDAVGDPHKAQLLNLLRLVQGDAETAEIAAAMKLDPLLSFRVLRYLNSPALALNHRIESLEQALVILGRQRLTRWLAILLFSVREPHFGDWLLIENALTRGRLMEVLAEQTMPNLPHDALFLTGIFSLLNRLLRRPLGDIVNDMRLADDIRLALLDRSGPYAPLLAVAEASENFNQQHMEETAQAAGLAPESVNRALLSATAWASEVTEYWD